MHWCEFSVQYGFYLNHCVCSGKTAFDVTQEIIFIFGKLDDWKKDLLKVEFCHFVNFCYKSPLAEQGLSVGV